ncbi:conserved hypothetical protein [delta proteobacterium NaphS2]|nr:conserved hypothetical protein [delta proteobacterium NaphS2]EFK08961.1 conserved hypothetical protein [delta proteobacterium NaphS2]
MSEATTENRTPERIIYEVRSIVYDEFHEQIDKLRFVRELVMNLSDEAEIGSQVGESNPPINGLFPILEDVTKAYDALLVKIKELAEECEEREVAA